jgi:hypothetical protein|tara:strand:+ start:1818 stop:2114 length:297 start_codon:yes stop_codon:yes gene_type:complete
MDSRNLVVILFIFLLSCDDLSCRFNKVPEAPYPDPDRVEEFKTNIINQVTYVYECLDNDKYQKQFVAITYTVERTYDPDQNSNINCWVESVYVNLGNC